MDLKNDSLNMSEIFAYNDVAKGTDAEFAVKNLIELVCNISDDNELLKDKLLEINQCVNNYPNDFELGNKIREIFKNIKNIA